MPDPTPDLTASETAQPSIAYDLLAPPVAQFHWFDARLGDLSEARRGDVATVCALLGTGPRAEQSQSLEGLRLLGLDPAQLIEAHEPASTAGGVTSIPQAASASGAGVRLMVLAGAGEGSARELREAGAALGRATRGRPDVVIALPDAVSRQSQLLTSLVEGFVLGQWAPPRFRSGGPVVTARPATEVTLCSLGPVAAATHATASAASVEPALVIERAVRRARAALLARTLGVTPSNLKNPPWLAGQARTLARRSGLKHRVWSDKDLRAEGFGGLLSVGGGSATPPRLVELRWEPRGDDPSTPHVVLVGKGITFDTGGLNMKPAEGMVAMKTDMMGAGAVLAVLTACRDLDIRVRVTGLLALAENAVSGSSQRPSDVITHYGGTTVEIGNTDAEGRIVLADALAYAVAHLEPDLLIDIATLTGAARVALARAMAPVFATDDDLRDALIGAGATTGETLWPLPLAPAYRGALDSDVADLKQFSNVHQGGSIMAALFLREFVGDVPWAHLDIAGPARSDVDAGLLSRGATGFGTRLLLTFLEGLR